jgi:phosphotransacetylase
MPDTLPSFDDLYREADRLAARVPVAVAGGADGTVLAALRQAADRAWIGPIVCGQEAEILQVAHDEHVSLAGFDLTNTDQPAQAAVAVVREGRARLLMKGQVPTPELMTAILATDTGLRTGRVICQVPLMEIAPAGRRLLLADTGVSIQPTLDQKIDILESAVELAHALGVSVPRVALLAATEKATASMPETLEAAEIARRREAGELRYGRLARLAGSRRDAYTTESKRDACTTSCLVQGPLTFDLAYAPEAGDRKRIAGPVVGRADVMIFPNLVSANLTIKAMMYTAPCRFGGVLCGAACPVVFMSRADSVETRLNSLALALRRLVF